MAELTYRDAVARGIAQEMQRDPCVVFIGEDVGAAGGVFKTTVGLLEQFGPQLPFPHSSGIERSKHGHMRELRIQHAGRPYRVLYVTGRPNWEYKFLHRAVDEDDQVQLFALVRVAKEM